jgi:hypothetical protein
VPDYVNNVTVKVLKKGFQTRSLPEFGAENVMDLRFTFSSVSDLITWLVYANIFTDVAEHSVEDMTRSFQRLPLADGARSERAGHCTHASTHITLGTRKGVTPVQCKYDVQTVVNHEASFHVFERTTSFEEYTLPGDIGTAKKLSDTMWAVYFNKARLVPAIFSGYYDDGE